MAQSFCYTILIFSIVLLNFIFVLGEHDRGQIIRRRYKSTTVRPSTTTTTEATSEEQVPVFSSPRPRRKKIRKPTSPKPTVLALPEMLFEASPIPAESMETPVHKAAIPPLVAVEELKKIMMEVAPISDDQPEETVLPSDIVADKYIPLERILAPVVDKRVETETQKPVIVVSPTTPLTTTTLEPEEKERVVKEWMLFRTGVPMDFSYNETAETPGAVVSARGCPKSIDGYPWVLFQADDKAEPKCYLVGQHSSVCGGSAVMSYQRNNEWGVCTCNFQECLLKNGLPLNPAQEELGGNALRKRTGGLPGKLRYRFCKPLGVTCEEFVYDQKEKRCDILYTQGHCKTGHWLHKNSKGGVACVPRLCEEGSALSSKSEEMQLNFGNVTLENAECCRPWGGLAVASVITRIGTSDCVVGQLYSETLRKCIMPLKTSSLMIG